MTVLLISRSMVYEDRLRRALESSDFHTVRDAFSGLNNYPNLRDLGEEAIDAIFVGPFVASENPRRRVARLRARFPLVPIVVAHEAAAAMSRRIRVAGANEVIHPEATAQTIVRALGVARADAQARSALDFNSEAWSAQTEYADSPPEGAGSQENHSLVPNLDAALAREEDESSLQNADDAPAPADSYPAEWIAIESDAPDDADSRAQAAAPTDPIPMTHQAGRHQVVAVVSPKGGLGKTTLATNLAVGLARLAPGSVVLIDADMQFGDVANVLSVSPAHTISDMVNGLGSRDSVVLKTLLTPHPTGLFAVCGSDSPAAGERVSAEQLGSLIDDLAGMFQYVVIDTSPGLGEHALTALDKSTDAVFVSGLSVPNLRALRTELGVLATIGAMPTARHLVLNMVDRNGGLRQRDAESIIGSAMDVVIPRSDAVIFSTNRGVPLLAAGSKDQATKAILGLLGRVFGNADRSLLRRDKRRAAA